MRLLQNFTVGCPSIRASVTKFQRALLTNWEFRGLSQTERLRQRALLVSWLALALASSLYSLLPISGGI